MSILEFISTIIGLFITGLIIILPLVLPAMWHSIWSEIKMAIYKFACYMTDGRREYDNNGDYISTNK